MTVKTSVKLVNAGQLGPMAQSFSKDVELLTLVYSYYEAESCSKDRKTLSNKIVERLDVLKKQLFARFINSENISYKNFFLGICNTPSYYFKFHSSNVENIQLERDTLSSLIQGGANSRPLAHGVYKNSMGTVNSMAIFNSPPFLDVGYLNFCVALVI